MWRVVLTVTKTEVQFGGGKLSLDDGNLDGKSKNMPEWWKQCKLPCLATIVLTVNRHKFLHFSEPMRAFRCKN